MKKQILISGTITLLLAASCRCKPPTRTAKFYAARSGSKMRIEGTSNIHDWQVESSIIGGMMEVGPGFPTEPGQAATPGKIDAKVEAFVTVRSLKSIEKDGRPYSDAMDNIMYEKLKVKRFRRFCTA